MKPIFEYSDYKTFVEERLKHMPSRGRGVMRQLALKLNVHPVVMSQIFKGKRDLSLGQGLEFTKFLGMSDLEREYFLLLVQKSRADTTEFRNYTETQLKEVRERAQELKHRLPQEKKLTEEAKALFYSAWYFSAIRLASSIPELDSVDRLAHRLDIPPAVASKVVSFLIQHGLCVEEKGKIKIGPRRTHLESDSLLMARNHSNWRLKGMERMPRITPDELFFSSPMAVEASLIPEIRKRLVAMIEELTKDVVESKSETLACLNIDWFRL